MENCQEFGAKLRRKDEKKQSFLVLESWLFSGHRFPKRSITHLCACSSVVGDFFFLLTVCLFVNVVEWMST